MFLLIRDVSPDTRQRGFIHRYDKVFILPCEFGFCEFVLVYPKGRFAFYQLHDPFKALVGPKRDQAMNVFKISVYEIYVDAFFAGILPYVFKYL